MCRTGRRYSRARDGTLGDIGYRDCWMSRDWIDEHYRPRAVQGKILYELQSCSLMEGMFYSYGQTFMFFFAWRSETENEDTHTTLFCTVCLQSIPHRSHSTFALKVTNFCVTAVLSDLHMDDSNWTGQSACQISYISNTMHMLVSQSSALMQFLLDADGCFYGFNYSEWNVFSFVKPCNMAAELICIISCFFVCQILPHSNCRAFTKMTNKHIQVV